MNKSIMDQELASMRDSLPWIWYALYDGGVAAGFTPTQAFALVNTFILSQCSAGIRPNDSHPKKEEET